MPTVRQDFWLGKEGKCRQDEIVETSTQRTTTYLTQCKSIYNEKLGLEPVMNELDGLFDLAGSLIVLHTDFYTKALA